MLVGVTVAGMAGGDPSRWLAIGGLTALMVAVMCVIAWALRLSTLISSSAKQFWWDSKLVQP